MKLFKKYLNTYGVNALLIGTAAIFSPVVFNYETKNEHCPLNKDFHLGNQLRTCLKIEC